MKHQRALLLGALHRNKPHARSRHCLADRGCTDRVVLAPLHIRLHVACRLARAIGLGSAKEGAVNGGPSAFQRSPSSGATPKFLGTGNRFSMVARGTRRSPPALYRVTSSCAWLSRRSGKTSISKVERRALEHVTLIVDNEAKAPAAGKERYSIPPFILVDSPFTQAGDRPLAHSLLDERRLDPKALCYDRHIDLNGAIFKLDHHHHRYHQLMCCDREFSIILYLVLNSSPPKLNLRAAGSVRAPPISTVPELSANAGVGLPIMSRHGWLMLYHGAHGILNQARPDPREQSTTSNFRQASIVAMMLPRPIASTSQSNWRGATGRACDAAVRHRCRSCSSIPIRCPSMDSPGAHGPNIRTTRACEKHRRV